MDILELIQNYFNRKKAFDNSNNESESKLENVKDWSSYITGDTIRSTRPREYLIPEVIDINDQNWSYRNRKDYNPINSESASITTFNNFTPKQKVTDKTGSFIGVNSQGKVKVGLYDDFTDDYLITRSYKNTIGDFIGKDNADNYDLSNRKLIYNKDSTIISSPSIKQPKYNFPLIETINDDGTKKVGSLNLFVPDSGKTDTYGATTGGRYIVKNGEKLILVSGSVDNLRDQINNIRQQAGNTPIDLYTLDNGTYNQGLRTFDKKLTEEDLKSYDNLNTGGGNFLYINSKKNKTENKTENKPNVKLFIDYDKLNEPMDLFQPFNLNKKPSNKKVEENIITNNDSNKGKIIQSSPKQSSTKSNTKTFNQAFEEARKQGLSVFEWNGKKYTTELKSNVEPKSNKQVESKQENKLIIKNPNMMKAIPVAGIPLPGIPVKPKSIPNRNYKITK